MTKGEKRKARKAARAIIVDATPQVGGGYRWVLACPRGPILVDQDEDGRLHAAPGLGYHCEADASRKDDLRGAMRTVRVHEARRYF